MNDDGHSIETIKTNLEEFENALRGARGLETQSIMREQTYWLVQLNYAHARADVSVIGAASNNQ